MQWIKGLTPLSWCIVVSTAANVAVAFMAAWFLIAKPYVNVEGYTDVSGSVKISSLPYDAVLKVKICDDRRCADLYPASTGFGGTNYLGLMVVPTK
jgi:hypothetical protein